MEVERIILRLIEGPFAQLESGVTEEGEAWFSAGESHLSVGKDCKLFKSWEVIATFNTPADLLSDVMKNLQINSEAVTN